MKKIKFSEKHIAIICILIFTASVIPLLILSFYNHPSYDDFRYSLVVKDTLSNGGNILSVLLAATSQVKSIYYSWQGSYSAVFLFALQPAVFGESFYALNTFILLGSLIFAVSFFLKTLCIDCLKLSKSHTTIFTSVILFLSVHCVVSPVEAFYWYNGSIYYTFFFSLMLLMFTLIIKLYFLRKNIQFNSIKSIFLFIFILILSVILAGGNYITALLTAVLLFSLSIFVSLSKTKFTLSKRISVWCLFALFMIGFIINIAAPGNAIRQALIPEQQGVAIAILKSFFYTGKHIIKWCLNPILIPVMLLTVPLIFKIASKLNFSFKLPLSAPIISIVLLAIQFTPTSYSQNSSGDKRVQNIIFYSFVLLTFVCLFYICGWIEKRFKVTEHKCFGKAKKCYCCLTVVLMVSTLVFMKPQTEKLTGVSAFISLQSGEAKAYHTEINERLDILENTDTKEVLLQPLQNKPHCLYWLDINNRYAAKYYGKDSIKTVSDSVE